MIYVYNIGRDEVTAGQYTEFLKAVAKTDTYGLYITGMATHHRWLRNSPEWLSGNYTYTVDANFVNRPVNFVSFGDRCALPTGCQRPAHTALQDTSTTEDGTYFVNGPTSTYGPADGHPQGHQVRHGR